MTSSEDRSNASLRHGMVTVIVPTKNRADFVLRLLAYYAAVGLRGSLIIADSSDAADAARIRGAVEGYARTLDAHVVACPGVRSAEAVRSALADCTTPYAITLPDDDFITARGLDAAVDFLEQNPGYVAATGVAVSIVMESGTAYGEIAAACPYRQRSIEGSSAAERLLDHLANYSVTVFAVHRRDVLERAYHTGDGTDQSFGGELLPCCLPVVEGNIKQLNEFYLVRSIHPRRGRLDDVYDWLTGPNWHAAYTAFASTLAQRIAELDQVALDDARAVVKRAFWEYLRVALDTKFPAPPGASPGWSGRVSRMAVRITRAPTLVRAIRGLHADRGARAARSLPELRNPTSPYYDDFRPIDDLIRRHVASSIA